MGEQIRIFNVGVLGETALPGFWVMSREERDTSPRLRDALIRAYAWIVAVVGVELLNLLYKPTARC